MPIISVDIPDVVPGQLLETLSESAIQEVLENIANSARNHWEKLAQQYLHTSRRDYIASLKDVQLWPGMAVITLEGQPANIIEHGIGMVDLREWLLGPRVPVAPFGQKGKRRAQHGGFYRAIPFRHQTPGTAGTIAPPMGDPYRGAIAGARELGQRVYEEALQLEGSKMSSDGERVVEYGGRLPEGMFPKLRAHHQTDIYAGMIRVEAAYEKAVQAQYMTFRSISTKLRQGWIRPPTGPRHFARRTSRFVARLAPEAFAAYVRGMEAST